MVWKAAGVTFHLGVVAAIVAALLGQWPLAGIAVVAACVAWIVGDFGPQSFAIAETVVVPYEPGPGDAESGAREPRRPLPSDDRQAVALQLDD